MGEPKLGGDPIQNECYRNTYMKTREQNPYPGVLVDRGPSVRVTRDQAMTVIDINVPRPYITLPSSPRRIKHPTATAGVKQAGVSACVHGWVVQRMINAKMQHGNMINSPTKMAGQHSVSNNNWHKSCPPNWDVPRPDAHPRQAYKTEHRAHEVFSPTGQKWHADTRTKSSGDGQIVIVGFNHQIYGSQASLLVREKKVDCGSKTSVRDSCVISTYLGVRR